MKVLITALALVSLVGMACSKGISDTAAATLRNMKYQNAGGLKMPVVGLGTWQASDEAELETALNAALDAGYRHIDTAFAYGNENVIGKVINQWIKDGKLKREDVFITTKLPQSGIHRDRVEKYMKQSLANLGLDYVDLYLIHFPVGTKEKKGVVEFEPHDHEGVWKAMEAQVDAGRAKTIGVSNFNVSQVDNLLKIARIKPACNQVELHVFLQQPDLVNFCQSKGIVMVAYSPIANPGYSQFLKLRGQAERKLVNVLKDPVISEIAKKHSKTNVQVALRFLVQKNIVVIPKSVKPSRLRENIDLFSFSLDDADMKKLEGLDIGEPARVVDWRVVPKLDEDPYYPFGSKSE